MYLQAKKIVFAWKTNVHYVHASENGPSRGPKVVRIS